MDLAVYMTRGMGISDWLRSGVLEREMALYRYQVNKGYVTSLAFFSYHPGDVELLQELQKQDNFYEKIALVVKPKFFLGRIGEYLFSVLGPVLNRKMLRKYQIHKSNQTDGAWAAMIGALFSDGYFYYRSGYCLSKFRKYQRRRIYVIKLTELIERTLCMFSNSCSVSSLSDLNVFKPYISNSDKILLMRNYVNTKVFQNDNPFEDRLNAAVFVGRITEQKNIRNLALACRQVNLPLHLYGSADDHRVIEELKMILGDNLCVFDRVAHSDLPEVLNKYKYFVMASFYEGSPKILIEAMACGCLCVATWVAGNKEIVDQNSGCISKSTDYEDIADALTDAMNMESADLKFKVQNAIDGILSEHTLEKYAEKEIEYLTSVKC